MAKRTKKVKASWTALYPHTPENPTDFFHVVDRNAVAAGAPFSYESWATLDQVKTRIRSLSGEGRSDVAADVAPEYKLTWVDAETSLAAELAQHAARDAAKAARDAQPTLRWNVQGDAVAMWFESK